MELKVWVEGVVRVVCGVSLNTPCQDVVIALAQAIGQTGRYVLVLKLRGTERQLVATDCPLKSLAQLGQLAAEVQFVLRRTGPSLSDGPNGSSSERLVPQPRPSEPEPLKHREPQKALTFNLGPSTAPRRKRSSRAWSPSPSASPEPRASPVHFLEPAEHFTTQPSYPSKAEVFRRILQQHEGLRELEIQIQELEREMWERERTPSPVLVLSPSLVEELEEQQLSLSRNEAELKHGEHWEKQLEIELDREEDMHRRLDVICSSIDDHDSQLRELQAHSAYLGQEIRLEAHRQSSRPSTPEPEETLWPLKQELQNRLQQQAELDRSLLQTETQLQDVEARLERLELIEEVNKELRQCNLQQFIQQTGVASAPLNSDLPNQDQAQFIASQYLHSAGILDDDLTDTATVC